MTQRDQSIQTRITIELLNYSVRVPPLHLSRGNFAFNVEHQKSSISEILFYFDK
jgi:hypothetical protein